MFLQFQTLPTMWRSNRPDCLVWLTAFFGVMLFGVVGGLAAGILALISSLLYSLMGTAELKAIGQFQNSEYYFDNTTTSHIYEFSGPLNFATAENLATKSVKDNGLLAGPVILVMSKEICSFNF